MDQGGAQGEETQEEAIKLKIMMMVNLFNLNTKCLIQECIKVYNEITPLTISLGVFEEG